MTIDVSSSINYLLLNLEESKAGFTDNSAVNFIEAFQYLVVVSSVDAFLCYALIKLSWGKFVLDLYLVGLPQKGHFRITMALLDGSP